MIAKMIEKPLFSGFSDSIYKFILTLMMIIMYTCVCAEADIYVPAFPQMIKYFGVAENEIQLVLSINFIALSIAGAIMGPLADSYGRRRVVLWGLAVFMLSSVILVILDDFKALLFWRFIQGFAAAVPMSCAGAIFFDKYSGEEASKLIGIINSFITAMMAAAPVIGALLCEYFNWRANFFAVMILSIIAFAGFLLFIEESLAENSRRKLNLKAIFKDYQQISSNPHFICYILLACAPFITILVYITNLSVIFVNHLGMDLAQYSYYQASTMGSFVLFSFLSVFIINKYGVEFTHNTGGALSFIGAVALFIISFVAPESAMSICVAMGILAAGGSLMSGTFGMKAMSMYPHMNATALAACTVLRLFLISVFVLISEIYFDGTIVPIAIIIFAYTIFTAGFYWFLKKSSNKT